MTWKPDQELPEKGKGKWLTDKQARFIEEYMVDLNASAAVLRAGYKPKPGNENRLGAELLQNPKIKRFLDMKKEEKREKNELSAEYVIQKLISIVEDTDKANPQAALRGLELLGKHLGMYKEKQEISGPDGEAIKMEQKVASNVSDFTRKLSRLAASGGGDNVVPFQKDE